MFLTYTLLAIASDGIRSHLEGSVCTAVDRLERACNGFATAGSSGKAFYARRCFPNGGANARGTHLQALNKSHYIHAIDFISLVPASVT